MRILVYEPVHRGHRYAHLALLAPALAQLADSVVIATGKAAVGSAEYATYLEPLRGCAEIDAWIPTYTPGPINAVRRTLRSFAPSVARARPDYIYIPYADGISMALGASRPAGSGRWLRGAQSEALLMRGAIAYPGPSPRARIRARALWTLTKMAPWNAVHHLDPIIYQKAQREGGAFARKLSLMPEPMDPPPTADRGEARRRLGIPEDGRYLGCSGSINARKGCDLLIRAFAAARLGPHDRLLLAGGHAPEVKAMLAGPHRDLVAQERIVSLDGFLGHEEFGLSLRAMDLVCTPYPRHIGSASIVIRAAAAHRPVVGSRFGWVGWAIDRFDLGRTCEVEDIEALSQALASELERAGSFQLSEAAQRFVRFHTPENYTGAWTRRLRSQLNLPPQGQTLEWKWVLDALNENDPAPGSASGAATAL
jgi:glycosyltransferase involved in cell wall biosynthesis